LIEGGGPGNGEKFQEHAFRLYEQEARGAIGSFDRSSRFWRVRSALAAMVASWSACQPFEPSSRLISALPGLFEYLGAKFSTRSTYAVVVVA